MLVGGKHDNTKECRPQIMKLSACAILASLSSLPLPGSECDLVVFILILLASALDPACFPGTSCSEFVLLDPSLVLPRAVWRSRPLPGDRNPNL